MKNLLFWLFILGGVFTSCTSVKYVSIQVLEPPQIILPFHPSDIVIADHQAYTIANDSLVYNINYYKLLEDSFNVSLKRSLKESPWLSETNISITSFHEFLKNNSKSSNLLLINIDSLAIRDTISLTYESLDAFSFEQLVKSTYEFRFMTKVSLKNLKVRSFDTYRISDTLYWSAYGQSISEAVHPLPNINMAAGEAGKLAGNTYAHHIAPFWTLQDRCLYWNFYPKMRHGFDTFMKGDFLIAIDAWKKVYHTQKGKIAFMAAFNISLAYEFMDDILSAKEWLLNAEELEKNQITENYLKLINQRRKQSVLLDKLLK